MQINLSIFFIKSSAKYDQMINILILKGDFKGDVTWNFIGGTSMGSFPRILKSIQFPQNINNQTSSRQ